jgi:hypothetical protein
MNAERIASPPSISSKFSYLIRIVDSMGCEVSTDHAWKLSSVLHRFASLGGAELGSNETWHQPAMPVDP